MGKVRLSRFSCINRLAEGPLAPHVAMHLLQSGVPFNVIAL